MSYPPQGYPGYPVYPVRPPDHPQAVTIMVLGIISIVGSFICVLPIVLGPVAWTMGTRARREIAESHGAIGGEGMVQAGLICGIISSCLLAAGVLFLVVILGIGILGGFESSSSY
ncbi:DUF4190 domain-containing protein [Nocardia huaxiensis]|uniref:DUF4190 domain-containing protein n=1 Tax=Nocardia huaxiensis TaxID=2755382 RepID=A0A7D6Z212_9NOCA|nr:DUF4190 domain-containing protein [Nocardia huaxiensis]QLY30786.1 DUF4190 domain-containing protein [Nocardia huaxiensis]UFS94279.1 DUF4190 domain-containing protein [Nocardia huaxiensis]